MPKIAFLFLLVRNPNKIDEWIKFFKNANKKHFSIYVHCSFPNNITEPIFVKNLIKNIIPTRWGDISLVKAMINLLREAYKDPEITHFHFVSDSCVPLYPFCDTYNMMTKSNKSNIEYIIDNERDNERDIRFNNYRQSQWITLIRKHVEFFLSNDYTNMFIKCEIPDESYFINTLLYIKPNEKDRIIPESLTYVCWNCDVPRPKTYKTIDDNTISDVYSGNCLFMRKIDTLCPMKFIVYKSNLINYLEQYKNDKCVFAPVGGWAGDAFITISAHNLFKKVGLNYEIYDSKKKYSYYKDCVFMVCGSGNLVNYYDSLSKSLSHWNETISFKKMIILPSTINAHFDVLNKLPDNTDIICRERISYHLVKNNVLKKKVLLSDDLAFYFDITEWKNKEPIYNNLISIRRDDESAYISFNDMLPNGYINNDIAEEFLGKCKNFKETNDACYKFLETISKYKTVYTNRLHTAIAAILIGRSVYVFPNSYYKNRGVYKTSMYTYKNALFVNKI